MRIKKWLAAVLGLPTGQHITVPTGAMLIMPRGSTVDTLNVSGGSVQFTETQEKLTSVVNRTAGPLGTIHWLGDVLDHQARAAKDLAEKSRTLQDG